MSRSCFVLTLICASLVYGQDFGALVNTFINLDPNLASALVTQYLNTFFGQNLNISDALIGQYTNILLSLNPNTTSELLNTFLNQNVEASNLLSSLTPQNLVNLALEPLNFNLENFFSDVVTPFANSLSTNDFCEHQILLLIQSLNKSEEWALKMVDAMAKPQAGILFGNIMHIGNYDECVEILKTLENEEIRGRYCTVPVISHPKYGSFFNFSVASTELEKYRLEIEPRLVSYGLCVPQVCSAEKLQGLLDFAEDLAGLPLHFKFNDNFCNSSAGKPLDQVAILGIVIFGLFAVVVVCSTLYELVRKDILDKSQDIYDAFSLISNSKKLFSIKKSHDAFRCLNGLRVISMMWLILTHELEFLFVLPHINSSKINEWKNNVFNSILSAGDFAIDTFLFIGGFLVVYSYMKDKNKSIRHFLVIYFFPKFLRLTLSLSMIILLSVSFFKYLGNGPLWFGVTEAIEGPCTRNWWSTLIYLQNYINPSDMCISQAWYFSIDIQMIFLSPFIMYCLVKWPKRTMTAIIVYIIAICCYVFGISFYKQIGCTIFDHSVDYMTYIFYPTHIRGSMYLLGMICGYYIDRKLQKPPHLSKLTVAFLWIISLGLMLAVVLTNSYFLKGTYRDWEPPLFNALSRPIWVLGLFGIIYLCHFGYGHYINLLLSHDLFTVIAGFNYNIYLLHMHILSLMLGQKQTPQHFSNLKKFSSFWGDYMFSLGLSILWTLMFDAPLKKVFSLTRKEDNSLRVEDGDVRNNKQ